MTGKYKIGKPDAYRYVVEYTTVLGVTHRVGAMAEIPDEKKVIELAENHGPGTYSVLDMTKPQGRTVESIKRARDGESQPGVFTVVPVTEEEG